VVLHHGREGGGAGGDEARPTASTACWAALRQLVGFIPSTCAFGKEGTETARIYVISGLPSRLAVIELSNGIRESANCVSPINEGHSVNSPIKLRERYGLALPFNSEIGAAETALHNNIRRVDIVHGEAAAGKEVITNSRRSVVRLRESSQ
jgi:hypothetical protein